MNFGRFPLLCVVAALATAAGVSAQTVSISGLYATGVDNNGVAMGNTALDAHYIVTANTAGNSQYSGTSYTVQTSSLGAGWVANTAAARWIVDPRPGSPDGTSNRPAGTFDYTLSFNLPVGSILSTVAISGTGAADDSATIYVNGTLVSGVSLAASDSTNSFSLTAANSAFVAGANTITFRVSNSSSSSTGLFISSLSGTAVVPEVGAFLPVVGALLLVAAMKLKRERRELPAI